MCLSGACWRRETSGTIFSIEKKPSFSDLLPMKKYSCFDMINGNAADTLSSSGAAMVVFEQPILAVITLKLNADWFEPLWFGTIWRLLRIQLPHKVNCLVPQLQKSSSDSVQPVATTVNPNRLLARIKCYKRNNQELQENLLFISTGASQANIYASSRDGISHSSAVSLPLQSGLQSWKQTGPSSNSTLADMAPSAEKPNKTDVSRSRGSLLGVGRLSLKG